MRIKALAQIAAVVTAAAGLVTAAVSQPRAAVATATKIMVVGDSISNGFNGDYTWRYRLWQQLRDAGILVDFVGPFQTVYNSVTQLQDLSYVDPNFDRDHDATIGRFASQEKDTIAGYVTTYQPSVLIINLGTNDLTWGAQTGTQVAATMSTLIGNARNAGPHNVAGQSTLQIVLSKLARLSDPFWQAKWSDYNTQLQTLAVQLSTATSPVVIGDPNLFGYDPAIDSRDGTHPSAAGEWKYAAAYYNGLGQLGYLPPPRVRPVPTGPPPMPGEAPGGRTRPAPTGGVQLP